ncbi:unnamed protein product [Penicillium camemberti]|uniref:Str. FM013 n=1 Tax=Penicillium camemberti (strain FM 013) TaxID=1429867 RepID=A0A0G4NTK1_PENC3|nr:unnamed protein product [Penicillium camemberti]
MPSETILFKFAPSRNLVHLSQPANQPVHGPGTSHSPPNLQWRWIRSHENKNKRHDLPHVPVELLPEIANRTRRITSRKSSAKCSNSHLRNGEWNHPCPYT